jgi:arylsulfatase A-like enzyme
MLLKHRSDRMKQRPREGAVAGTKERGEGEATMTLPPTWLAPVLLVLCLAALGGAGAAQRRKPNLVLIMTDDQGWPELGVHGNPVLETPNLDRLAGEGVRLSRFYASPVCTPTRAALMTGRYAHRTGACDTYMGRDTMSASEITLPQLLKGAGYRTGLIGKWHLGRYKKYHPNSRGFDHFFGFWQYGFINRYFDSPELFENGQPVTTAGYVTDVLTDEAIRFVQKDRSAPFFLYLAYNAPHSPHQSPDALTEKYLKKGLGLQDAQIYGMIDSVDRNVGRLLEILDRQGLSQDTLVVFMTDNGHVSGHFNAGLRGRKASVFEGGIRVPFIARWPGRFPAGRVVAAPVQHIDVFPTFCEVAGVPVPAGRKIDGRSLTTLLKNGGGESPHRYLYHQWTRVRPDADANWAIHEGRHKLVNGMLFDLEKDPGEQVDLASAQPGRVAEMRQVFLDWFADVTAGQTYARVPIEAGRTDENPVEIDLTWGEPRGARVKPQSRHYNRDFVADWSETGDAVDWKLDVVRAGEYKVELTYGCDPPDAGGRYRISAGAARLDGLTEAGGRKDVYLRRTVGVLDLPKGETTLTLEAVSIPGRSLMELHRVRLLRR